MPNIARVNDFAACPADAHTGCTMPVNGWFTAGSSNVRANGRGVIRVGDGGSHVACPGPNTFTAASGNPKVRANGQNVVREGDTTTHCGLSSGSVTSGLCSPNTRG